MSDREPAIFVLQLLSNVTYDSVLTAFRVLSSIRAVVSLDNES